MIFHEWSYTDRPTLPVFRILYRTLISIGVTSVITFSRVLATSPVISSRISYVQWSPGLGSSIATTACAVWAWMALGAAAGVGADCADALVARRQSARKAAQRS